MNISRIPASTSAQAASVPTPTRNPETKAAARTQTEMSTAAPLQQRLANLTSKVEKRVANALEKGQLNDEQIQNLRAASEKFQALMTRIGNADFKNGPKRQVMYALHQFTQNVSAVLHPEPVDGAQATGTPVKLNASNISKLDKLA